MKCYLCKRTMKRKEPSCYTTYRLANGDVRYMHWCKPCDEKHGEQIEVERQRRDHYAEWAASMRTRDTATDPAQPLLPFAGA